MTNRLIFLSIILLAFSNCKKRHLPIQWDADYTIPLAYGSLGIVDLLSDTLTSVNTDQTVWLNFNSQLFELNLDSIIEMPTSDISDTFELPFPVAILINPGQPFINQMEEHKFDIQDVELTSIDILSASFNYTLRSTIQGEIVYEYIINSATDDQGNIFSKEINVPAANPGQFAVISGNLNLDGYTWDLTGLSGNKTNTIVTTVNVKVSENNSASLSLSNLDTLFFNNEITSFQLNNARGYFGEQSIAVGPEIIPIARMDKITSGSIDISQFHIDLNFNNGVGADARIKLNDLFVVDPSTNNNINLIHSIINQPLNINRAYENGNTIIPSSQNVTIDNINSNIESLFEALPDQLGYDIDLMINPLGNVSGNNDFIFKDYPFSIDLNISMPLDLIATDLALTDTIEINLPDTSAINYGKLYIEIENGFPFNAQLMISIPQGTQDLIDPNQIISGIVGTNGIITQKTESTHEIDLSSEDIELLKANKKIILNIVLNTADQANHLDLYDFYELNFKISADFNATVSIQ